MQPKISVIVPAYNSEKYLCECLDSIVNQTYKNIEILIVMDKSSDNSENIILEYQKKDTRIKLIKNEIKKGIGAARNIGIKESTGKYLGFVDSDDFLELTCFENMIALLESSPQNNCGLFATWAFYTETKEYFFNPYQDIPDITDAEWYLDTNTAVWTKIFKRSDIVDNNIYFIEDSNHEDENFWWKYCSLIDIHPVTDSTKYYHLRYHSKSTTHSTDTRIDMPIIIEDIYNFMKLHNILESNRSYYIHVLAYLTYHTHQKCVDKSLYFSRLKNLFDQQTLTDDELKQLDFATQLCYLLKNQQAVEYSFLNGLMDNPKDDKWYKFGQLSKQQKVKHIIIACLKKIGLYSVIKTVKNNKIKRG